MRPAVACGAAFLLLTTAAGGTVGGQDTSAVILDFRRPPGDSTRRAEVPPDSLLDLAIARFNEPGTSRIFGPSQIQSAITGTIGVHDGHLLVSGTITGDVIVINGDLRLVTGGRIDGTVMVVGGQFFLDPGATHNGSVLSHRSSAPVRRLPNGTLTRIGRLSSLRDLTGAASVRLGPVALSPHVGVGIYNRVEGLPIALGASASWAPDPGFELIARADVIGRTTSDPVDTRGDFGWRASLEARNSGAPHLRMSIGIGNEVVATSNEPLDPLEAALSALLLRRDLRDWYGREGGSITASWLPLRQITLTGTLGFHRDRSLQATETFSILRADESWRDNPLIDDGRYTTAELRASIDTRERDQQGGGWLLAGGMRHTSSGELTPVPVPEQIRDPVDTESYRSWSAWVDLRRSVRLDLRHSLSIRVSGAGWIAGDPMLLQHRLAIGGGEPLPGFGFREVNCDLRRRPDAALPALCDRMIFAQGEFRRTIALGLGSRVGAFALGVDQLDLVLFANTGSAWLAGRGPGQVRPDRIQSISEWRGDVGIGVDGGIIGAYIAKAVTDGDPFRFGVRLTRRF